ncbi:MAG: ATP-binding protein [Chloroflexi bacterium]|nr:ATP-binding protein [Chloroflexota bacterium]
MLRKHPDQYEDRELKALVRHLVDEKVSEGPTLDYKETIDLDSQNNKGKLEAAKDISSFANEKGGTIIYGIPEDKQSDEVAIPKEPYGIEPIPGLEERLENIYVDSILPRLPECRVLKVELTKYPSKVVYVVWTPESWLGPHMVRAYREKRYYHRGQLRAVLMEEHEVRLRYERSQRLKSQVYEFLDSQQQLFESWYKKFIEGSQRPLIGNYILCPHFLEPERVQLFSTDMRGWLAGNRYVDEGGISCEWRPCADGVESFRWSETHESRIDCGEAIIYRKGAITCWGKTCVKRQDDKWLILYQFELRRLWKILQFGAKFYEKISYYGPLWFRVSIYNPTGEILWRKLSNFPEEWCSLRSRGQSPLNLDFELSSADLFIDPKPIIKRVADELYRLLGMDEAPSLEAEFWKHVLGR